jgi:hypothetical protein
MKSLEFFCTSMLCGVGRHCIAKRLVEVKNKHRDLTNQSIIFAALSTEKDLQTRARLRQEIRRKVPE